MSTLLHRRFPVQLCPIMICRYFSCSEGQRFYRKRRSLIAKSDHLKPVPPVIVRRLIERPLAAEPIVTPAGNVTVIVATFVETVVTGLLPGAARVILTLNLDS